MQPGPGGCDDGQVCGMLYTLSLSVVWITSDVCLIILCAAVVVVCSFSLSFGDHAAVGHRIQP